MNALILGGNSPRHKDWVRQVAEALQPHFKQVRYLDYRHWDQGGDTNVAYEMQKGAELASTLGSDYVIVAKSIGTVITIIGHAAELLKPQRCVLLGFPLALVQKSSELDDNLAAMAQGLPKFDQVVAQLPETVVIQNDHDPLGSYEDVNAYMARHGNSQMMSISAPGDTHDYIDFELIMRCALDTQSRD